MIRSRVKNTVKPVLAFSALKLHYTENKMHTATYRDQNTEQCIMAIFKVLTRGEQYIYHEGMLANDREKSFMVATKAEVAFDAYKQNMITLTQRRIGPSVYQYIAIGR
jgi:hypothetical protein